jgi:hypothetical protein
LANHERRSRLEEVIDMAKNRAVSAESLPIPPTPSASTAGRTMQESVYKRRVEPRGLPKDAPNILIVLIDDAGPGLPTTERFFGLITDKAIRRDSFTSLKELVRKIEHFVTHYNRHCQPLVWTATADSILAKLEGLTSRISGTAH